MAAEDEGTAIGPGDYVSPTLASFILRPIIRRLDRKAEPRRVGVIELSGLKEKVRILWDPHAVPHVFAQNEHDLFFAQGYLHAQERLWQMDFNRRFLCGRLAEILGNWTLSWKELPPYLRGRRISDLDYFVRLLGLRRAALSSLEALPEEFPKKLQAYSEGINRYIESHVKTLPLEFRLLRYEPEPWKPEDSLTIGKGFALFLSTALITRLTLTAIAGKLKGQEEKLKSLYPSCPDSEPCITRFAGAGALELLRFISGTFEKLPFQIGGQGSNNWAVAPARSATGRAILCNDPHLRLGLPSVWYLMHLRSHDGYEAWGGSIPGTPCIHIGHNRRIAWGVTAALCDDGELYLEKISGDLYLAGGAWEKMERLEEKIRIRGGREIKKTIRLTRHGPLISDFFAGTPSGETLAFKWTAHEPGGEFLVVYGVNTARDWNEFLRSLSHQVAPTLNYVYADIQGNIGYSLAGKIPLRSRPSFFPLPGWSGDYEWRGYLPFAELPRLYNPPEGLIATANNRVVDEAYPHYLSDLFEPPYRIRRIRELLSAKEKLSVEDMGRMFLDPVSLQAPEILRALGADMEEASRDDPLLKDAVARLLRWNGSCGEDSVEASLFHVFYQRLRLNLLVPELGEELAFAYIDIFNQALLPVDRILGEPRSPWFDSRPRRNLVGNSLREAVRELTEKLGGDIAGWRWGKIHTLSLQHPLSYVKPLAPILSIERFPTPGDWVTVNMGFYQHSQPYEHVVGATLRMIADVRGTISSKFVICGGQSGHPFSPHYGDLAKLWRQGGFVRLTYDEEEMKDWPFLTLTAESRE